jgi:alpha-beta hydrolase superfamily lysophospholipase
MILAAAAMRASTTVLRLRQERRLQECGTSTLYPGMRHETMHEKDADKVMKGVADWVLENIKK